VRRRAWLVRLRQRRQLCRLPRRLLRRLLRRVRRVAAPTRSPFDGPKKGDVLEAIAEAEAGSSSAVNLFSEDIGATQLADMLRENATVAVMYLSDNQIGRARAGGWAAGERDGGGDNTRRCNQIGDEGARALADGLKENATGDGVR